MSLIEIPGGQTSLSPLQSCLLFTVSIPSFSLARQTAWKGLLRCLLYIRSYPNCSGFVLPTGDLTWPRPGGSGHLAAGQQGLCSWGLAGHQQGKQGGAWPACFSSSRRPAPACLRDAASVPGERHPQALPQPLRASRWLRPCGEAEQGRRPPRVSPEPEAAWDAKGTGPGG